MVQEVESSFASSTKAFDFDYLLMLIKKKNINRIINYYNTYFVKIGENKSVIMWVPGKKTFDCLADDVFKRTYCPPNTNVVRLLPGGTKHVWKVSEWFFGAENSPYRSCMKVGYPRIFKDETGDRYVNLLPRRLHEGKERRVKYSKKIQDGVNKIWNHLFVAWTSRNKDQFEYLQKWFGHFVSGRRLQSCIYLRAIEGIGKSCVIEFLKKGVIGESLVFQTSNTDILTGQFNAPLFGKMLFVLEEAPCSTSNEWHKLNEKLKDYITADNIAIRFMHRDYIYVDNTVSYIINTNSYAVALNHSSRRYMAFDCSSEYKGNKKHFDELLVAMRDPEVGEAFYFNCLDIAKKYPEFDEQHEIPLTKETLQNINDNAPSIVSFIKEDYILENKGINKKFRDFYEEYEQYCKAKKITHIQKRGQIGQKLLELGIKYEARSTKHHNAGWVKNSASELYELFNKKRLIAIYDDVNDEDKTIDLLEHNSPKELNAQVNIDYTKFENVECEMSDGEYEFVESESTVVESESELDNLHKVEPDDSFSNYECEMSDGEYEYVDVEKNKKTRKKSLYTSNIVIDSMKEFVEKEQSKMSIKHKCPKVKTKQIKSEATQTRVIKIQPINSDEELTLQFD